MFYAYLFGYDAKGTVTLQSDVDICLVLDEQKLPSSLYDYMFKTQEELTKVAGGREVEAIPRQLMSYPLYCISVLFGKPIFSRENHDRISFENRAFDDHFDIKPFHGMRYKKIMKRLHRKQIYKH